MDPVVVCGSRFTDASDDRQLAAMMAIDDRMAELPDNTLIVTGGAVGADRWAHAFAIAQERPTKVIRADWETHGKRAGFLRNLLMLDENPVLVIAVWDGKSKGTMHTVREAMRRGIPVEMQEF